MDRFRQMQVFLQVMENRSFTRAAAALGIPRSTVSTEIQALEDRLGCQLLHRTTRRITPTPDGEAFLPAARDIVESLASAEAMFAPDRPALTGRLRIGMPSRIGRRIAIPALPDLLAAHPGLTVELSASDQLTDLIANGVDCVLRLGALESSDLVCRKLGDVAFATCASPAYLARHGPPRLPGDLAGHLLVNYAPHLAATPATLSVTENGNAREIGLPSPVTVDGAEAYIAAGMAGLGLIQIPAFDVQDLLASGELVAVLADHAPPPLPLSLLFARRRNLSARVRIFQDWLQRLLAQHGVIAGS